MKTTCNSTQQHHLKPIEFYIDYFKQQLSKTYYHRCYDRSDIQQQATLILLEHYPKIKKMVDNGRQFTDIIAYLSKIISNRLKNYKLQNNFAVSAKNWQTYDTKRDYFYNNCQSVISIDCVSDQFFGSGINYQSTIDLTIDLQTFCDKYDPDNLIKMLIEGYNIVEIARMNGQKRSAVTKKYKRLKRRLIQSGIFGTLVSKVQ